MSAESAGRPEIKDLTVTAEADLVDTVPMATIDHPDREFLPKRISVRYWPTPEGWRIWTVYILGHAILKSGEVGKRERCAYYSASLGGHRDDTDAAPDWAREFAAANCPLDGAR